MTASALEPGVAEAVTAIQAVTHMPPQMARNYLEMLGHAATKFMRAKFGEEYTRGYLEAALAELDQPPMLTLRKPS
ncbi:MAG: hypothetical protein ABW154_07725 [Dyella sp.]